MSLCFLAHGAVAQSNVPNIEALRQAVDENPADAETRRKLGQAYFRERQSKPALDQYQEALRLEPLNEDLYLEAAAIFLAAGLADQVEAIMLEASRRFPNSTSAGYNPLYHDLAELWAGSGRVEKASQAMKMAARFEGPVAGGVLYKRIGDFNTDLLRFDEALSNYARALDFDPENPAIHLALGNLHLQRNNAGRALSEFTQVISSQPRSVGALYGIAEARRRMDRLEESVAAAGKALEIDPNHSGARYIRGAALVRLGRGREGQRDLEQYRKLQAEAETETHRRRERQTFKTTGMFRLLGGQFEEAIAVFKEGVAAYPDVAELYFNLGLAQSQSGKHRAAIETFQELLGRGIATDILVHRYLAQEYLAVGEVEAAERHQAIYVKKREAELGARPPG
ncbi:MAG: tetratricopeptide repeat protein [Acidobacteria bacterium]|nr:tetratricopeptide repeat protein [Acidobacteriota bacterium]